MKVLSFSLMLLAAQNVFSDDLEVNGQIKVSKFDHDSLKVNGSFTCEEFEDLSSINSSNKNLKCKTLRSNGSFDIDGLIVRDIKNNGSFNGKNIEISGHGQFNGNVDITNSSINTIEISSDRSSFSNSKIDKIFFKKFNSGWSIFSKSSSPQILELKDETTVNDIEFEDNGEVHLFDKSRVIGKISNGKVVKH
jgi:hypothetical protein